MLFTVKQKNGMLCHGFDFQFWVLFLFPFMFITQSKSKTQITRSVHCKFNCISVNYIGTRHDIYSTNEYNRVQPNNTNIAQVIGPHSKCSIKEISNFLPNFRLQNNILKRHFQVIFSFQVCLCDLGLVLKSKNCNFIT